MAEDDDFGRPPGFGDDDELSRLQRVRAMTDEQLLADHARLHHPSLADDLWLPLLEAEIRRRGLVGLH
jgi:hypothetical protein